MSDNWKKILIEVLTKIGIVGNNWSGEIVISINHGGVSWISKKETIK